MSDSVFSVLVGILVGGLLKAAVDSIERRRQSESILVAIVSEVRTICDLMDHQQYLKAVQELTGAMRKGSWAGETIVIDIRANYFSVYESLTNQLGLLKPTAIVKIVSFYAYCKSATDSTRPDGPLSHGARSEDTGGNLIALEGTLAAILTQGDEIALLPKAKVPKALAE